MAHPAPDPIAVPGDDKIIHEILPVGMLQCNCSIIGDPKRAKRWSSIPATKPIKF